jgi:hypothetical protein
MSWMLFIIMIFVSFVAVRIGAIAFQLTGLEWSLAKFQSLSCFTGTGFTTQEAELITGDRQRRRIASILMVLGNAGFVVMIATFANSLRPQQIFQEKLALASSFFGPRVFAALDKSAGHHPGCARHIQNLQEPEILEAIDQFPQKESNKERAVHKCLIRGASTGNRRLRGQQDRHKRWEPCP